MNTFKLLLLEDNVADADLLQELLTEATHITWQITWVEHLGSALSKIGESTFDVVLSDLSLPDAHGLDAVIQLHALSPDLPIVVLTVFEDEAQGLEAIRQGAEDYLIKGRVDYNLLARTIRYAIERAHTRRVMRQQSAAMAACGEGIGILNQAQEYIYLNQAHARIYGYDNPTELVGKTWKVLYDEAEQKRIEQQILLTVQCQGHWFGEAIGRRRDGIQFDQELSITALKEGGFICTMRDITDRKRADEVLRESEARFRLLADTAPVLIWMSSVDSLCTYLNQGWLNFTGRTLEQEIDNGWIESLHPDDVQHCLETYQTAFAVQQECITEYRLRRFDGEYRWILDVGIPRFTPDGSFLGYIGSCIDISDRKQVEAEISKALARERELNQLKSHFVSMVSHEFRTPMTAIRTATELLQHYNQKLTDEKKTKYYGQIYTSIHHMLHLLDEILLLGKTEVGGLRYEPACFNLEEFCRELVEIFQISLDNLHTIHFTCRGECTRVNMDEVLLRHIFTNLLSNAVKYSPAGGDIRFDLTCQDRVVTFKVQDPGIGIPLKDQQHLFETFHRASNASQIQGTGLGLAIVKNCVDLHRGQVQVESEIGVGTTFTVVLPSKPLRYE
jgi:PAS domain S-box-containing protein